MSIEDVKVPDIGDFKNVPVIEILVKPGDTVKAEDAIVTLESDKATMDVPSPAAGKVVEVLIKLGDKVSEGTPILKLESGAAAGAAPSPAPAASAPASAAPAAAAATPRAATPAPQQDLSKGPGDATDAPLVKGRAIPPPMDFGDAHASPSVRRLARELEVDLKRVTGTGEKGRITKDDVKRAVAGKAAAAPAGSGFGIPEIPAQDFSKFGAIEEKPLSRLKKLSGPHLHRAWLNIPHVTHTDEADVTELEDYRKSLDKAAKDKGYRVTLLAFLLKASVACLKEFPEFNASLSPTKDALIYKKYYNIGVAVDTPDGLVVPVIKDVNAKGIIELSKELGDVSAKMRDGKITPADISGATFSISSLGGIGGTSFTPVVNAPEVAILGVVRSSLKPQWNGKEFVPRLMLPLCVSYDHRVIDGALAARFTRRLAEFLGDVRQLVL
ncbi:MAG: dihydrolipoyllysine-residue acetyltransferase [Hyphomicrobiaceae bacterium]|nr:dihydrolipoyllysine-residue acetyltransferase [Hyphomicrobiaceae bacterium]